MKIHNPKFVDYYDQQYGHKENKLELSWAKLSLAGAMVVDLGIVEF